MSTVEERMRRSLAGGEVAAILDRAFERAFIEIEVAFDSYPDWLDELVRQIHQRHRDRSIKTLRRRAAFAPLARGAA